MEDGGLVLLVTLDDVLNLDDDKGSKNKQIDLLFVILILLARGSAAILKNATPFTIHEKPHRPQISLQYASRSSAEIFFTSFSFFHFRHISYNPQKKQQTHSSSVATVS